MQQRALVVLVGVIALAVTSPLRAQVGDAPPPPEPLEAVELPPVEDPPDPADVLLDEPDVAPPEPPEPLPPPERAPTPLPPPDVSVSLESCPSAPPWPLAAGAAGLGGGLTFVAAAGGLLALSWASTTSGVASDVAPFALLLGATTLPFLAALGAGAAVLPLGQPVTPSHFGELCAVCGASWVLSLCIVGAAVGGGSLGCGSPSCGSCDSPFGDGDGGALDGRPDVYLAAVGAGLGAVAGGALMWLVAAGLPPLFPGADLSLLTLGQIVGGAALGSAVLGGLGGAYGAQQFEEELASTAPVPCRERP